MDIEKSISATDKERWEDQLIERKHALDTREVRLDAREARLDAREARLDARESDLRDMAGEIQEREKQAREDEKRAQERARVNRTDYLFEAINRDNHKYVVVPPMVQVIQPARQKEEVSGMEFLGAAMSMIALVVLLILIVLQ